LEAIDRDKYEILLVGIGKNGTWHLNESSAFLLRTENSDLIEINASGDALALVAGGQDRRLINLSGSASIDPVDVVFPVLHGPFGEDGTVQGLLKLAGVPFVGAGVLGSAVGMDKDVSKRLLREAELPVAGFRVIRAGAADNADFAALCNSLGLPFFIKPANLGSSVGVAKVKQKDDFNKALAEAFTYDTKVLAEEYIKGREIECSVLGNDDPVASVPGEVVPQAEFYSYEAKYIDENGAVLNVPADLQSETAARVRELAVKAFKVLCCEGMARVDFFLTANSELFINELNTIPGFTKISMYPRLWEASGVSYSELIDRLITLALEKAERESRLSTSYQS
jgi:D-alanine-D-alanine ligase